MALTVAQKNQLQSDINAADADQNNAALRGKYYDDVNQFGDPYGALAAGVATNSTLDGVVANTFLQDTAMSQYGVNLTPAQISVISTQLMDADFQVRQASTDPTALTPQQISEYHTEVFDANGLGDGVWTETLPFSISPSTLTMVETDGFPGVMAIFGLMLASGYVDEGATPSPAQSAAAAWLGAVVHGLLNYLGTQLSAAGSAFVKSFLSLFGIGEQDPLVIDVSGNGLNLLPESAATPCSTLSAMAWPAIRPGLAPGMASSRSPGPMASWTTEPISFAASRNSRRWTTTATGSSMRPTLSSANSSSGRI